MSIKVVCGCGFFTLLPSEWEGKRVKCKCGRSFIVGASGTLAEPPAAADEPALPPTADPRRPVTEDPSPPEPLIPPVPDPSLPAEMPVPRVDMRPPRHASRPRHKFAQAVTLLLLAVASSSALIVVLRDHGWSVAAILGVAPRQESTPPPVAPASIDSAAQVATGPLDAPPAEQGVEATAGTVAGAETGTSSGTRLANLTPLAAEDGLLLTGMFGDDYQRLQLSESQQESADSLVARLKQNDQGLKDKNVTLEQWYADSRKAGDELLAVLTDAQRQQLQVMLERGEVSHLHLVEYSARIRPELAVAQMPWSVPSEGRSFRAIAKSSFTASGQDRASRASEPTGWLATYSSAPAADTPPRVTVWDLAKDEQAGGFDVTSPLADSVNFLSRDGRHWVLVRQSGSGAALAEVWSTETGKVGSKEIPSIDGAACVPRDCVGDRLVGLAGHGYWTWDLPSGETRVNEFPDSQPAAAPGFCLSAEGHFLVVAHVHAAANPPDESSFVEVCLYRLETGELLGNQVFHQDYRGSTISAIAYSNDGRELALLWDLDPPNAERRLVHMSAANGKIIKTVTGLPPADQGYAHRHGLPDRDLFWLSENSGWVVNLQNVVDAETGAVLDLDLNLLATGGTLSGDGPAAAAVVEAAPTGDGRLLLIVAEPAPSAEQPARMRTQFLDLPKLGPFQ